MDINKVWLSGLAVSEPVLTTLGHHKTPFCTFTLQISEQYLSKDRSTTKVKRNRLKIESLGKNAHSTHQKVKKGKRYYVDGYVRQDFVDGQEEIKIRTFVVLEEESDHSRYYQDGLRQARDILDRSLDIESARLTLESVISGRAPIQ